MCGFAARLQRLSPFLLLCFVTSCGSAQPRPIGALDNGQCPAGESAYAPSDGTPVCISTRYKVFAFCMNNVGKKSEALSRVRAEKAKLSASYSCVQASAEAESKATLDLKTEFAQNDAGVLACVEDFVKAGQPLPQQDDMSVDVFAECRSDPENYKFVVTLTRLDAPTPSPTTPLTISCIKAADGGKVSISAAQYGAGRYRLTGRLVASDSAVTFRYAGLTVRTPSSGTNLTLCEQKTQGYGTVDVTVPDCEFRLTEAPTAQRSH